MARADWDYVHLPKSMIDELKKISDSPNSQKKGLTTPSKLVEELVRRFFDENSFDLK